MAVTRQTLKLADGIRVALDATVDDTTRALVREWARAWNELATEWQNVADDLVAAGGRVPRGKLLKAKRTQRALAATRDALLELGKHAGVTITEPVTDLVAAGAAGQADLIASQHPRSAAVMAVDFARVDDKALAAIVKRSTQQILAGTKPVAREVEAAMRAKLIRGVAVGENPRAAARQMVTGLEGRFNWGLNRALVVARTEMLDAHRAAGMAQEKANTDVVTGWTWLSALDVRTCPSCWAMHGSEHPVTEEGPDDHQQGRCTRLPLLKPWSELGFDITEPASLVPDAQDVFAGLSADDQLLVMGRTRLDLLGSGQIGWSDLSTKRSAAGWRDSHGVTPLKDLAAA